MPKTKFKHYPIRPKKLTAEFVKKEYNKLLKRLPEAEAAKSPKLWLELFADWNALQSYIGGEASRIYFVYHGNMKNIQMLAKEKYLREKVFPLTFEPNHALTKAFLNSRHRQRLAQRYGRQLVPVYETILQPLDPRNTQLRIKVGKLQNKYDQKLASARVFVQGKRVSLRKAAQLMESPDEKIRREAFMANKSWFYKNRPYLAGIYDGMVSIRHHMGKNLGYSSYLPLAYQNMGRVDYGPALVRQYRKSIRKYIVPLNRKLAQKQAKALGKTKLRPWDGYDPETSLPIGIVPVNQQLAKAERLFNNLSPRLAKHFAYMRRQRLIDLETRENKKTGAYCTEFSDEAKIAIFCNSTGNATDVRELTHEMGHAFQGWESQHIKAIDLQWGTMDLAEVFSMSMEFLSLRHMDIFFDDDNLKKFRQERWSQTIGMLCYSCVVDEYQHWVYAHPQASLAARDRQWGKIANEYLSPSDYTGYRKYQNLRWYGQGHIFTSPFYYIDYGLAEICAMQLALIDAKDHKKAMAIYLKLCRLGGTKSFLEAIKSVGLRSPFDEKLIASLAKHAEKMLRFCAIA